MSKQNVPELRIDRFEGEWASRTLGEMGSTFGGLTGKSKEDFGHGEARYVTYMNVFTTPIISDSLGCGRIEVDRKQQEVKFGDVFFTTSSEVPEEVGLSAVWLVDLPDTYLNSFCFGFRPKVKLDLYFLAHVLRSPSARGQFRMLAQGISRFNISKKKAMEIEIMYPADTAEQQAIGAVFTKLDTTITSHRKKLDLLKQTKTSLLQRMFPQDGATVPELRLEDFSGSWKEESLADIATYSKGKGYSKADMTEEGMPLFHYGRLYTKYELAVSDVDTFSKVHADSILSRGDEVLVPASGETAEDIATASALLQPGVLLGGDLNVIRPHSGFNSVFLALSLSHGEPKAALAKRAQGKSVVHVHNPDIQSLVVLFPPTLEEQRSISAVFTKLDSLIGAEAQYIDKLTQTKTALLQKMFV